MENEISVMAASLGYRLIKIILAFALLFLILRAFDWIAGYKFKSARAKWLEVPTAAAMYYGLRFVGAAYLVAQTWGV